MKLLGIIRETILNARKKYVFSKRKYKVWKCVFEGITRKVVEDLGCPLHSITILSQSNQARKRKRHPN